VGTIQPNYGLDELFGAVQENVEFMPDILAEVTFGMNGIRVRGGVYTQSYTPVRGKVCGRYSNGSPAVIENVFGEGRTLLIGTYPSEAYYRTRDESNRDYFADLLIWAGVSPHVRLSDRKLQARLSARPDTGLVLWILNSRKEPVQAELELSDKWGSPKVSRVYWGESPFFQADGKLRVTLQGKDALVLELSQ
jgi:beta-galactosidase